MIKNIDIPAGKQTIIGGSPVVGPCRISLYATAAVNLVLIDVPPIDPAVAAARAREAALAELIRLDHRMGRVLEDLLAVLSAKGILKEIDLPADAQQKLARRRELRAGLAKS